MKTRIPVGRRTRARAGRAVGAMLALGAAAVSGGCGNVTSGGFGDVEVVLSSDEVVDLQASAVSMAAARGGDAELVTVSDSVEGTLTVRVRSFARRGVADFVEITDGVQEVTVSLSDPTPVRIARMPLPAGTYSGIRTFFGRIEATIQRGLVVDGQPLVGLVNVDLGALGTLSVVTDATFDVVEEAPTVIAVEMQSRVWLRLVDGVLRRVTLDDFRRIFRVRVRRLLQTGG